MFCAAKLGQGIICSKDRLLFHTTWQRRKMRCLFFSTAGSFERFFQCVSCKRFAQKADAPSFVAESELLPSVAAAMRTCVLHLVTDTVCLECSKVLQLSRARTKPRLWDAPLPEVRQSDTTSSGSSAPSVAPDGAMPTAVVLCADAAARRVIRRALSAKGVLCVLSRDFPDCTRFPQKQRGLC